MKPQITHATAQGVRDHQEDRLKIDANNDGILIAIFDGHHGHSTSQFCEHNLLKAFNFVANNPAYPSIEDKMKGVFQFLVDLTSGFESGSTGSIVFIPNSLDRALVGVLGDSPVIIKASNGDYWHSPEHNVSNNPQEVLRVKKGGCQVYNGYVFPPTSGFTTTGFQLTRAFGDSAYSEVLLREPEIFEIPLGLGSFVLVGSDGLFDPSHKSNDSYHLITNLIEKGATAGNLVKHALDIPTMDNVSAILVRIGE